LIEFIRENKEWLFSGVGVTILLTIGVFIKRKFFRKQRYAGDVSDSQQITVHIHPSGTIETSEKADIVPIKRISPLKFSEIRDAIKQAPPLQKDESRKSFIGINVEWDAYLKSASKDKRNVASLWLAPGPKEVDRLSTIRCKVSLDDYRELGILPEGSKIRVQGKIAEADEYDVELVDAKLFFLENR